MSTWGQNPYDAYTQQAHQWEQEQRRRQALEDQRYRDRLSMIEQSAAIPNTPAWTGGKHSGPSLPDPRNVDPAVGGKSSRARGEGPIDRLCAWLVDGSIWFVEHIWPLRASKNGFVALAKKGESRKLNAMLALVGALVLPTVVGAASGSLLLLAAGAVAGWFAVRAVAVAGVVLIALIGLAVMLGLIAGAVWSVLQIL